jgi:hypothetical protein
MNKTFMVWFSSTFAIFSGCLSFIPPDCFTSIWAYTEQGSYWGETLNKVLLLLVIGVLTGVVMGLWMCFRKSVSIKGYNYVIKIEYGDIFKVKNCNKVIGFDECFTTEVGRLPHQIKPSSICGQFLSKFPNIDLSSLINNSRITPLERRSEYAGKVCYPSGSLIPFDDYLLMVFAKLNSDGRANMTRKEYTDALSKLWQEIDKYNDQRDVAIPVLGSGITRFKDTSLNQQQLVDVLIASYRLSPYKIKSPHKLRIVCAKTDNFSLNKIGKSL